jgi:hypothetical protein
MCKHISHILIFLFLNTLTAFAQSPVSKKHFFEDDKLVTLDLSTDLKGLVSDKKKETWQLANVSFHFPDSTVISEEIKLTARGEFRRKECFIPSIKFDFRNPGSPRLAKLGKLKLVVGCGMRSADEKLILREFLVYKIYNLFTPMSFRVRLLRINYNDTRGKIKRYTQYGFLIEDVDDVAKRNNCREVEKQVFRTETTDRQQTTLVAIFQYMIGNTDWAVPNYHNVKLMRPVTDTISFPYTVPYDFDFCGMVDAPYAIPIEELNIKSVRERLYRGYSRTLPEIETTLTLFREKSEAVKKLVLSFELLPERDRKEILDYLDGFYKTIESKSLVQKVFIDDARTN